MNMLFTQQLGSSTSACVHVSKRKSDSLDTVLSRNLALTIALKGAYLNR